MQISQMRQTIVLVVDGNEIDRLKLKRILEPRVQFCEVSFGSEVMSYFNEHHVDLLLLADKLPDTDGFDILRKVHGDVRYKDMPVIIVTDDLSQKMEAAVAMAGGFDIIRKPFVPIIVVKKVEQVLELAQVELRCFD